jgi:hypothetical protein
MKAESWKIPFIAIGGAALLSLFIAGASGLLSDKEVTLHAVRVVSCGEESLDLIDDGERVTHIRLVDAPGCEIWKRSDLWDLTMKSDGGNNYHFISAQTAF